MFLSWELHQVTCTAIPQVLPTGSFHVHGRNEDRFPQHVASRQPHTHSLPRLALVCRILLPYLVRRGFSQSVGLPETGGKLFVRTAEVPQITVLVYTDADNYWRPSASRNQLGVSLRTSLCLNITRLIKRIRMIIIRINPFTADPVKALHFAILV